MIMLQSNELMIGDWVLYNPNVFIEDEYEPTKECYPTKISSWEDLDLAVEGCYTPIPLTPEILEKNGFVLKEEEKGAYGVDIAPYYTRDDVPFEVFCDGEPFAIWFKDPVNIGYVHELQHALRLCGITREIII